uniref:Uncharacterized protein n=1 Tax=Rhizophora mucronata TaxID=61149 RepID=A0A2P2NVT1_RHIMU
MIQKNSMHYLVRSC